MFYDIIYQDENVLVINKSAGITVFDGHPKKEKSLIDYLLDLMPEMRLAGAPPRYGAVHRLDKETSGIVIVAKNEKALLFLQKQFKNREVIKKYIALVWDIPKESEGEIISHIGRAPSGFKQKAYSLHDPKIKNKIKREAVTKWQVLKKYKNFCLIEASPLTGRKHQIRVHFAHIGHPIVGDKLYSFKNQPQPKTLDRHFLHANCLKIKLPYGDGEIKEFEANLPDELKQFLKNL